ncbi:MAG: hypothetical protein A3F35_01840 [Candidatus Woykebacteria bacterium RIFCSPHIGHO2_12_FULL_45_10]|uniref:Small ribosomal subunit protein bS20 n=1 Tax=Candidatus Woykebacteria bacterium RIFCSPHIGHO2_12_FULL_45_10 TaxID=1802603 RepID=A0A1G1WRZ5_9BACT|nr:MAG: hypothetical protein A3F35_01840 [Candidatus Woykebacteria bacterium RIFCSPHIGHO2_12_FULL_45_10]
MPLIKGAIKKLRQDRARALRNKSTRAALAKTLKTARAAGSKETLTKAFSDLDKAVKINLIKKGRANRIKSRLSKSVVSSEKPLKKRVNKKNKNKSKKPSV